LSYPVSISRRRLLIGAGAFGVSGLAGCGGSRTNDLSALALPPLPGLTRRGEPVSGLLNGELTRSVAVLVAWSSSCSFCRQNHNFLLTTREQPKFVIGAVVSNDSASDACDYLMRYGNPYNFVAFDGDMQLAKLTGYSAVPTTYLVDDTAKVRNVFIGAFDQGRLDSELMPALRQLVDVLVTDQLISADLATLDCLGARAHLSGNHAGPC
jgi:cytochrome c biogenesis protein CcmG, thiol:disulfide interchange protein DsbE